MGKKLLPDFIIIGAMKAGTTSLYNYLTFSDQINMSKDKETNFFTQSVYFKTDLSWYHSQFMYADKIKGEASPNYSKFPEFPGVPERIHSIVPNVKMIYILRDPVERIVSQLWHSSHTGMITESTESYGISFRDSDLERNHTVNASRYCMQLKQYLKFFDLENILIITLDELNKKQTLENIFKFININSDFLHQEDIFHKIYHKSSEKKRITNIGKSVLKYGLHKYLKKIIPHSFYPHLSSYFYRKNVLKPQLDESLEKKLRVFLREDIKELENITGKTFPDWSLW